MKRKIISAILSSLLVFTSLVSCTGKSGETETSDPSETTPPDNAYDVDTATDVKLYGAPRLWYSANALSSDGTITLSEGGDGTCCLINGDTVISPSILGIDLSAFPYLLVCADGEITDATLAVYVKNGNSISERESASVTVSTISGGALLALTSPVMAEGDVINRVTLSPAGDTLSIRYIAFFPTAEAAEMFDAGAYSDYISTYNGETVNYTEADDTTAADYLSAAQTRIAEIRAAEDVDPSTITGERYYFSSVNGDDANDGLSPQTPKKTMERLAKMSKRLKPGDAVFFERGSVWRKTQHTNYSGDYCFMMLDGVTYAAYGEGDKPCFYGSVSGKGAELWEATEYENIWRFTGNITPMNRSDEPVFGMGDVGNIVFNGGEAWGIKVTPQSPYNPYNGNPSVLSGMVTNGTDVYRSGGVALENPGSLLGELEFLHDLSCDALYLRCSSGNPGEVFDDIEISTHGNITLGQDFSTAKNVTLDNLCFMYTGSHGIGTLGMSGVTVQNCEFGWIGGSVQGAGNSDCSSGRYGNAIENYGACDGMTVRDCYIYEVYDAALTTQGEEDTMRDIVYENNVISRANYAIELFADYAVGENGERIGCIDDVSVRGNYLLYSGYGFGHQRPDKNGCAFRVSGEEGLFINAVFEENICLYPTMFTGVRYPVAYSEETGDGPVFRNNIYLADADRTYFVRTWSDALGNTGEKKAGQSFYPYTERYIRYFADIFGTEQGSVFYYTQGAPLFPEENEGVYR